MAVWIWKDVLWDWTPGMVVVEAETKKEAIEKVMKTDIGEKGKAEILASTPKRLRKGKVEYVYGGS